MRGIEADAARQTSSVQRSRESDCDNCVEVYRKEGNDNDLHDSIRTVAMATTQPEREIPHERAFAWQMEPKAEYKSLRMSWVVVTDERGQRQLCMRWIAVED
jgi:hypothetical protein